MTALDSRPTTAGDAPCGLLIPDLLLLLDVCEWSAERRARDMYAEGYRAAEQDMAAHWAKLSRSVRADADRLTGRVSEPVTRSNGIPDASIWFTAQEWADWAGVA